MFRAHNLRIRKRTSGRRLNELENKFSNSYRSLSSSSYGKINDDKSRFNNQSKKKSSLSSAKQTMPSMLKLFPIGCKIEHDFIIFEDDSSSSSYLSSSLESIKELA